MKYKVILGYTVNWRTVWATRDTVSKTEQTHGMWTWGLKLEGEHW